MQGLGRAGCSLESSLPRCVASLSLPQMLNIAAGRPMSDHLIQQVRYKHTSYKHKYHSVSKDEHGLYIKTSSTFSFHLDK